MEANLRAKSFPSHVCFEWHFQCNGEETKWTTRNSFHIIDFSIKTRGEVRNGIESELKMKSCHVNASHYRCMRISPTTSMDATWFNYQCRLILFSYRWFFVEKFTFTSHPLLMLSWKKIMRITECEECRNWDLIRCGIFWYNCWLIKNYGVYDENNFTLRYFLEFRRKYFGFKK